MLFKDLPWPGVMSSFDVPAHQGAAQVHDAYLVAGGLEDGREALFQSVDRTGERRTGRPWTRQVALASDQAAGGSGGAAAVDVLPHVPGDGDHGVPVERGYP